MDDIKNGIIELASIEFISEVENDEQTYMFAVKIQSLFKFTN